MRQAPFLQEHFLEDAFYTFHEDQLPVTEHT